MNSLTTTSNELSGKFPWFALQVWSRRESMVATQLRGQGYDCFLPTYVAVRRWSDRAKQIEQPLFPGYLFCRFDFTNRRPIVLTPGVVQIVGVGGKPAPLEDSEVQAVQEAVASGLPRQPWPYLEIGESVRVDQGSLNGLEGLLVSIKGHHRVIISITLLQRSVALEIDMSWITPLRRRNDLEKQKDVVCSTIAAPAIS